MINCRTVARGRQNKGHVARRAVELLVMWLCSCCSASSTLSGRV